MADHDARTRAYDFGSADPSKSEQPTTRLPRTPAQTTYTGNSEQSPPPATPRFAPTAAPATTGHPRAQAPAHPGVIARIGATLLAVPLYAICLAAFTCIPLLIIATDLSTTAEAIAGGSVEAMSPVGTMLLTMLSAVAFFLLALTMRLSGTGVVVAGAVSLLGGIACFLFHGPVTTSLVQSEIWQGQLAMAQALAAPISGMAVSFLAAEAVVFGAALIGAGAAVSSARRHGWRKALGF